MIANHDPEPLSAAVAQKMADGGYAEYIRKHPIAQMDAPSSAVLTQWAKGAPNGLVSLEGRREETVFIRNYNVTPQLPANGLTVAELFCGGGLMAVGLQAAGYDITFANDFDKRAVEAYAYNIGDHVICGDITDEALQARIPDTDVIAGGPPCQDYSVAGEGAGEEGERGKLVWTYLQTIADRQPKAFVFENVKGLIMKKHRPTFDALLAEFGRIGYAVSWRLINAWDYGVAQKRERVFIVGVRKDLGFTFEFPEPSAVDYRTQVLRDVIGDLPEPIANNEEKIITEKALEGYARRNAGGAFGFRVNPWEEPSPTIMGRIFNEGKAFVHPSYTDNHHGHLFDNINPDWTYEKANRVTSWESPSLTVRSHARNEGVHPAPQPRRFTVRECLRIQSVPDTYVLPDTISLSAQYRIVGNGVASRVSYVIGVALAEQLNAALAVDLREAA